MLDKLVEIPVADWPALRDLYKEDWPRNHVGYYTLDNFIRWVNLDPNIKHLKVLSLNGDWSDGTFVIIVSIRIDSKNIYEIRSFAFDISNLFCPNFRIGTNCSSIL